MPPGNPTLTCALASSAPPEPRNYAEPRNAQAHPAIRRLAADAQLRAANVALLGAGTLGESARKLGEAAGRLADQVSRTGNAASGGVGVADVSELDASIRAFQRRAAAVSRVLAGGSGAVLTESAGRSPRGGRTTGDGQP